MAYREDSWSKGFYIDNHMKYECLSCDKQFIMGEKLSENCSGGYPCCPYCEKKNIEKIVWTHDAMLEDLDSDMGCLAIHFMKKSESDCAVDISNM